MRVLTLARRSLLVLSLAAYVSDSAGIKTGELRRAESGAGLLGKKRQSIGKPLQRRMASPAGADSRWFGLPPKMQEARRPLSASGMVRMTSWIRSAVHSSGFQTALAAMAGAVACFIGTTSVRMAMRCRASSRLDMHGKLPLIFPTSNSPSRAASGSSNDSTVAQTAAPMLTPRFAAPLNNHLERAKTREAGMKKANSMPTPSKKLVPDPLDPTKWTYVPIRAEPRPMPATVEAVASHSSHKTGLAMASPGAIKDMPDASTCKSAHVATSLLRLGAVAERRQQFEAWRSEQEERRKRFNND